MKQLNLLIPQNNIGRIASEIEAIATEYYRQGWQDAIEALKTAAGQANIFNGQVTPKGKQRKGRRPSTSSPDELSEGTLHAHAYNFIKENPGKTGIEIINGLRDAGVEFEGDGQAIRTALFRLRRKMNLIDNKDGKWYAV